MESSILSEVDDTSILRTGLPTPLWLSSQLATDLSPLAPRSGLERSDFVPCFTADAALKSPMIDLKGHAAIRDFVGRFSAQQAAGVQFRPWSQTSPPGSMASGRGNGLLVLISQNGAHRGFRRKYECDLVKQDGAWRFNRRTVFHDHEYSLER